ncbi:hypothetical protein JCM10908_005012 [Rhodotorula pacifica]|uniref:uncharacterized protein n=1 Tax=Rhodotorula pacifica TaxID=1495444 RepID=UPI00318284C3
MDYAPRHAQPVTLAQLRQLEPELLTGEIARLENSIQHLEASNVELREWAGIGTATTTSTQDDEIDEDSKREFAEAVRENEETIASQQERLTMIRLALEEKIGVDAANPHYERASARQSTAAATANEMDVETTSSSLSGVSAATQTQQQQSPGDASSETAVNGGPPSAPEDDGMYL